MYFLSLMLMVLMYVSNTDGCKIEVFAACNYGGQKWTYTGPIKKTHANFQNDVISSWKIYSNPGEKCAFYLFNGNEDTPQYGTKHYSVSDGASQSISCAVNIGFNDVISTIIIREEKPDCAVELFAADLYGGAFYGPFGFGQYKLTQLQSRGVPNDVISSIKVTVYPNIDCVVELYEGDLFSNQYGKAVIPIPRDYDFVKEYAFNLQTLQSYGFKNDALSSMIVKVKETIKKVTWQLDQKSVLMTAPYAMGTVNYDNVLSTSPTNWQKTISKEETTAWAVSYSHTVGASVEWAVEFGSPIFGASQSLTVSLSYSFTLDSSKSGSTTDTYSETISKVINPGQKGYCEWTMKKTNVDVPFSATINKMDGYGQLTQEIVGGVWKGVALHDSTIQCIDDNTNCNGDAVAFRFYVNDKYILHTLIFSIMFNLIIIGYCCCGYDKKGNKTTKYQSVKTVYGDDDSSIL